VGRNLDCLGPQKFSFSGVIVNHWFTWCRKSSEVSIRLVDPSILEMKDVLSDVMKGQ
jgi:hypothetical protein